MVVCQHILPSLDAGVNWSDLQAQHMIDNLWLPQHWLIVNLVVTSTLYFIAISYLL